MEYKTLFMLITSVCAVGCVGQRSFAICYDYNAWSFPTTFDESGNYVIELNDGTTMASVSCDVKVPNPKTSGLVCHPGPDYTLKSEITILPPDDTKTPYQAHWNGNRQSFAVKVTKDSKVLYTGTVNAVNTEHFSPPGNDSLVCNRVISTFTLDPTGN